MLGFAGMRGELGYVTPADRLAGLGARILALARSPVVGDSRAVGRTRGARGWVKGTTASD